MKFCPGAQLAYTNCIKTGLKIVKIILIFCTKSHLAISEFSAIIIIVKGRETENLKKKISKKNKKTS